ncbi:hypothetical protein [Amycolatopsis saalfeldensis]|uniref:Uncharacterized protein n=1 Tax=Amycolatopsis saalfeldensis TaxID=394193 RepID=A0A1H8YQH2_9PSEU|nr:hypothetical protein [Amycolatopsis saalfeldensis]SEP54292.1 hypothetical protein SAMN04489732_14216 [Amycolatopsis saalfeldensis]
MATRQNLLKPGLENLASEEGIDGSALLSAWRVHLAGGAVRAYEYLTSAR